MEVSTLYRLFLYSAYNVLHFTSKDYGGETMMRTYHLQEWIEMVQALAIRIMERLPELLSESNKEKTE